MRMCELLATLDGPAYIERVALTNARQNMRARKAVRKAPEPGRGRGFSFVEILPRPSGWKSLPKRRIAGWKIHGPSLPAPGLPDLTTATVSRRDRCEQGGGIPFAADPRCRRRRRRRAEAWPGHDRGSPDAERVRRAGCSLPGWRWPKGPCAKGWRSPGSLPMGRKCAGDGPLPPASLPATDRFPDQPPHEPDCLQSALDRKVRPRDPAGRALVGECLDGEGVPDRKDIRIVRIPSYEIASNWAAPNRPTWSLGAYRN